jgi:hypothetical protein
VEAFDMSLEAPRQAARQLSGSTARGTAAHGCQNGFDAAHDCLLLMDGSKMPDRLIRRIDLAQRLLWRPSIDPGQRPWMIFRQN